MINGLPTHYLSIFKQPRFQTLKQQIKMGLFSETRRKAGKLEVLQSAEHLLDQKREVTTLEVKLDLRAQGYVAFQAEVSFWMAQLAQEQDWLYTFNGTFRVYHLAPNEEWVEALLEVCMN